MENNNITLVIDDNHNIQEFLRTTLPPFTKVIQAFSIEEARKKFAEEEGITHILMDGRLNPASKGSDTIELTKEIRQKFKGIMVAISQDDDFNKALIEAGCDYSSRKEDCLPFFIKILTEK
jgi:CheY-like chemotaxis protein